MRSVGWRPGFIYIPTQGVTCLTGSPSPDRYVEFLSLQAATVELSLIRTLKTITSYSLSASLHVL